VNGLFFRLNNNRWVHVGVSTIDGVQALPPAGNSGTTLLAMNAMTFSSACAFAWTLKRNGIQNSAV